MQKNIIWKGLDADTTENCAVTYLEGGIVVRSEIMGWHHGSALTAEYVIRLDKGWNVTGFELKAHAKGKEEFYSMKRDGAGRWTDASGKDYPGFAGCRYIDITLTPLTNTLPINGLGLAEGETGEIEVLYIDVLGNTLSRDRQQYTKLGRLKYRFENDNGNFTADIDVDEEGFVTDYPGLFETI